MWHHLLPFFSPLTWLSLLLLLVMSLSPPHGLPFIPLTPLLPPSPLLSLLQALWSPHPPLCHLPMLTIVYSATPIALGVDVIVPPCCPIMVGGFVILLLFLSPVVVIPSHHCWFMGVGHWLSLLLALCCPIIVRI